MADVPEDVLRWTAKRRVALVLSVIWGETSVVEAARKHGLNVAEVEDWQERFSRRGGERAAGSTGEDPRRARPAAHLALEERARGDRGAGPAAADDRVGRPSRRPMLH